MKIDQPQPRKAGRPPLSEAERAKKRTVYLTEADWEKLIRVGVGNPSNGIRLLLTKRRED